MGPARHDSAPEYLFSGSGDLTRTFLSYVDEAENMIELLQDATVELASNPHTPFLQTHEKYNYLKDMSFDDLIEPRRKHERRRLPFESVLELKLVEQSS